MEDKELRELIRKWISQANHPQHEHHPEVRDAILKCATDLSEAIRKSNLERAARPTTEISETPEGRLLHAIFGKKTGRHHNDS